MLKQRKKYLFNKFLIVILLYLNYIQVTAQSSFILELKGEFNAFDITEDAKGGYIASIYSNLFRYSAQGQLLWKIKTPGYSDKLYSFPNADKFCYFGGGIPLVGSFEYAKFSIKGRLEKLVYNDPVNETEVVWDYIYDKEREQFVVCGWKYWIKNSSKTSYWIAGVDTSGKILWQKINTDTGKSRFWKHIFKNKKTGGYILIGAEFPYNSRRELFNVDSFGNIISRNPVEPNPSSGLDGYSDYKLHCISLVNDSFLLATVIGREDSVKLVKYNMDCKLLYKVDLGPDGMNQISNNRIVGWGAAGIGVYDENLNLLWEKEVYKLDRNLEVIYILKAYQSRDGGFYGIAEGKRSIGNGLPWSETENIIYIFKTDSLGNINPKHEFSEKQQPMMLQPNPAQHAVRIAIPYYFGNISASFYDLQGRLWFEKTQNEQIPFDIRTLATGVYVVKAKVLETGEQRIMKLVVE